MTKHENSEELTRLRKNLAVEKKTLGIAKFRMQDCKNEIRSSNINLKRQRKRLEQVKNVGEEREIAGEIKWSTNWIIMRKEILIICEQSVQKQMKRINVLKEKLKTMKIEKLHV